MRPSGLSSQSQFTSRSLILMETIGNMPIQTNVHFSASDIQFGSRYFSFGTLFFSEKVLIWAIFDTEPDYRGDRRAKLRRASSPPEVLSEME